MPCYRVIGLKANGTEFDEFVFARADNLILVVYEAECMGATVISLIVKVS